MQINKKKINRIIETILLIIIFIIGIRKGGYYKSDSLPLVFLIVFFGIIYLLLNIRDIKKNSIIFLFLIILASSYVIPLIIRNVATISGAINVAIKIFSLSIIYIIFVNSDSKENIKKWVVLSTIIFGTLAIDECSFKIFEPILNFVGGGYLVDNNGRLAGVMQYSNILALMCLISIIFTLYDEKRISIKKAIITFFTLIIALTESKLVMLLYILTFLVYAIKNKRYISMFYCIINLAYCIIISSLMITYNAILVFIIATILLALYLYLEYKLKDRNKIKEIINIFLFLVLILLVLLLFFNENIGIIKSIKEYFNNFNSTRLRLVYYIDSLKLIIQTPKNFIFGLGGNAFRTMYETVQEIEYISLETHSAIFQIFLESGMVGILSFLGMVIYILKKATNDSVKLAFFTIFVFLCFDVFLTYTFMLYLFIIIVSLLNVKTSLINIKQNVLYITACLVFGVIITIQFIAYMYMPVTIGNLNNTLEKQESVIHNMEVSLKLDPYDLEYRRLYTQALNIYIEILNTKEELYGVDNSIQKQDAISKIYNNVKKENSYEKSNKYTIEDYVYYVYKYLDNLVLINYSGNINLGYEEYLNDMIANLDKLYKEHSYNDYALDIYDEYLNLIYDKYIYVNTILNDIKITNTLNSLKENEYISL